MHGRMTTGLACDTPLGRALVLTGSVGSGHTRAAEAVVEAMIGVDAAHSAIVTDALAHASLWFRTAYRDAYVSLIERAPTAVGWLYRSSDRVEGGGIRRAVQRHALARLRRLIREEKPDTIVCTHFLPAEIVSTMVERGEWRGLFGVVVTDLDAHAVWAACPRADRWFVALPETAEILAGKGVPRDRMVVTGIPISGAFSSRLPGRGELRARWGFAADQPMILVSGGGVGISMLDDTLEQLLALPFPCGIALVCGRNQRLFERASRMVESRSGGQVRCIPLGFTDRMHELMAAADLAIGKPGGLTSSEALACGLPLAIVRPVPGQEERNADHLLEWGAAIRLNSPESLGWRVAALLRDEARLRSMREAARRHASPFAADSVVDALVKVNRPAAAHAAVPPTHQLRLASAAHAGQQLVRDQ